MMSCASCGQAIPPAESDLLCPRCGSVDRNVAVADYGTVVDEVTGLDVRFLPAPAAWQEMWAEVRHNLDILRGWYSGGQGVNITELRAASLAFFVSCYHLTDHIEKDPAVPQPARAQVRNYTNSNPSLKWVAPEVRRGSWFGFVSESREVDGAGGVECFLRAADGQPGEQDSVLVAVAGGGVDREAEGMGGAAVAEPEQRDLLAVAEHAGDVGEAAVVSGPDFG